MKIHFYARDTAEQTLYTCGRWSNVADLSSLVEQVRKDLEGNELVHDLPRGISPREYRPLNETEQKIFFETLRR